MYVLDRQGVKRPLTGDFSTNKNKLLIITRLALKLIEITCQITASNELVSRFSWILFQHYLKHSC